MTAVTVAAASHALRDAAAGTFAVAEAPDGPRFPNGYIPSGRGSADWLRPTATIPGPLATTVSANRWWDSQIRAAPLEPHVVARFLASTETMTLPGPPEDCIGWGPGLTPAGDDVAVGMLAAFHAVGASDRVAALAASCAEGETVAFSRSLIDHAAQGRVVRPMLDLLNALGGRLPLDPAIAVLRRFGATSGRHLLYGVRQALVEARPTVRAIR